MDRQEHLAVQTMTGSLEIALNLIQAVILEDTVSAHDPRRAQLTMLVLTGSVVVTGKQRIAIGLLVKIN